MSKEIRRLHRKQNQFTNFSSKRLSESSNLSESNEFEIENASGKFQRRQSRQRQNNSLDTDISASSNSTEPTERDIENDSRINSSFFAPLRSDDIDSIRAELREDAYHSQLAQSDFSDDTHDWGGDRLSLSDDYWHFVGSFE